MNASDIRDKLRAIKPKTQKVFIEDWGMELTLKEMSGSARELFDQENQKTKNKNILARLVILSVVDETGNLVFNTTDIPWLNDLGLNGLNQAAKAIMSLSAVGVDEIEAEKKS